MISCSSRQASSAGVFHQMRSREDISLAWQHPNVQRLRDEGGEIVARIVFSGLFAGTEGKCSVERPKGSWNPWGTGLLGLR